MVPAHWATIFRQQAFQRAQITDLLADIDEMLRGNLADFPARGFLQTPPSGQKREGMLWRIMLQNEIFRPPVP